MCTEFFKLSQKPFTALPDATKRVAAEPFSDAMRRCRRGVDEAQGPILVVGPSGCGKSMLLASLEHKFHSHMTCVMLNCQIQDREALIQCLLFEFGVETAGASEGQCRLRLIDYLKSESQCPKRVLLLVDEAHLLCDDVLEELRMITNIIRDGAQTVQLVLAGDPTLEERLAMPRMESMNQRIATRCYLGAMTRQETLSYVLGHMQSAGCDGRAIFRPAAIEKVHELSGGIARVVSQLCSGALQLAAEAKQSTIGAEEMARAWSELQQLPDPAANTVAETPAADVVEFGNLDDDQALNTELPDTSITEGDLSQDDQPERTRDQDTAAPPGNPETVNSSREQNVVSETPSETRESSVDDKLRVLLQQLSELEKDDQQSLEPAKPAAAAAPQTRPVAPNHNDLFGETFQSQETVVDWQASSETVSADSEAPPKPTDSLGKEIKKSDSFEDAGASYPQMPLKPSSCHESDAEEDILVLNRVSGLSNKHPDLPADPPSPDNDSESARGASQAIRMDYQDLFRQLRNDSNK